MPPRCDKCGEYISNGSCKCSYHVELFHVTWTFQIVAPGMRDLTKDQIDKLEREIGGEVFKNMTGWHMRCHAARYNLGFNSDTIKERILKILK